MSGADDQRAAERLRDVVVCHCYEIAGPVGGGHWASCLAEEIGDEVTAVLVDRDRLRAELAETRARRDYLQGQLDIIYDAEYSRNDALKRRIEKMGAAGDALAGEVTAMLTGPVPDSGGWWSRLAPKVDAWRSVRGDAPTPGARQHQEVLRDGQVRIRLGERGIEIVPDAAAPAVARTDGQPPTDEPQYAIIKVATETAGMAGWAWPVVERVAGGWQSGAHHYPDADVEQVRPLTLHPAPAGDTTAPDPLADTLRLIAAHGCSRFTRGDCTTDGSKGRVSFTGTADQWCDECRAHDALVRAGVSLPCSEPMDLDRYGHPHQRCALPEGHRSGHAAAGGSAPASTDGDQ